MTEKILNSEIAKPVFVTSILLFFIATSAGSASAEPIGVPGLLEIEQDENFEGQFIIGCMGPGFINCSIVGAFAFGACQDFFLIGQVCVGAGAGTAGSISSVGIPDVEGRIYGGGGALGTVTLGRDPDTALPLNCVWHGFSGGCVDIKGFAGFACPSVSATGHGYLGARAAFISSPVETIPGPALLATAVPPDCEKLVTALLQGINANPGFEPADLEDAVKVVARSATAGALQNQRDLFGKMHVTPELSNMMEAAFDDAELAAEEWIAQIIVREDYSVIFPEAWEA